MELTARPARPIRMMHSARGLIVAAALTALVAGCGTTVAGSGSGSGSGSGPRTNSSAITTSTTAGACASADEVTKVTVLRAMHLVQPTRMGSLEVTQSNPRIVRALFDDFCQIVTHKDNPGVVSCPIDIGLSYGGTFYDGSRPLATFTYTASGCEVVTITGASKSAKPESSMVFGTAADAAPNLHADMAKALGMAEPQVFRPNSAHVNQGSGPSK